MAYALRNVEIGVLLYFVGKGFRCRLSSYAWLVCPSVCSLVYSSFSVVIYSRRRESDPEVYHGKYVMGTSLVGTWVLMGVKTTSVSCIVHKGCGTPNHLTARRDHTTSQLAYYSRLWKGDINPQVAW